MWRNSVAAMFVRISFLPFCLVVFALICFHAVKTINALNDAQSEQAQRIAGLMSVVASQRPFPMEMMTEQVNTLLKSTDTLASVNFYPLNQPLPEESQNAKMFDDYLSRNAAVMVNNDDDSSTLMGYINVTMDLKKAREPLIRNILTELLIASALLLGLFVLLLASFGSASGSLRRLLEMSQKVLSGDYQVSILEQHRSNTTEMRHFEDAMVAMSTKVQLLENDIDAMQEANKLLSRREQSVNYRQMTFQSLVTHELKTPLNAISGGIQLLDSQSLSVSALDSLNLIRRGHLRLSKLLEDIIDLNNLQQGSVTLVEQRFNPEILLRTLAENFSQRCLQKGIQLAVDIQHTEMEMLGDREKILQLLGYILDNAVKFTSSGSITLISRVVHGSSNSIHWQCDIEDTGVGIEQRIQQDIFKPYFQADSSNSREYEGSGLGLTLANKLAELMSGQITVTSQLGHGSAFRLLLNVKDASQLANRVSLEGLSLLHMHTGQTNEFAHQIAELGAYILDFTNIKRAQTVLLSEKIDIITICQNYTPEQACEFASVVREKEFTHRSVIVYFVPENHQIDELWLNSAGIDYIHVFTTIDETARQFLDWLEV